MSSKSPDEEVKSEASDMCSLKSLSKHLTREKHINSRNTKCSSLSNANSQYSTKEGTPNKESNADSKAIEVDKINIALNDVSMASTSDKLSNITRILNQNDYNYSSIKEKIPFSANGNDKFVFNMLYKTTTLRTEKIRERVNDMRPLSPQKKKPEEINSKPTRKNRKVGVNNKERISCCFFFR